MSRPARSLFLFAIYVLITGVAFIVAPAPLMSVLGLPPATVGWARMIGILALVIGAYDIAGSRAECLPYIRASIPVRFGFATSVTLLVIFGQMPLTVLVLGIIDGLGALWTLVALRSAATVAEAS